MPTADSTSTATPVTAAGQALSASRAKYVYYVPETDFVGTDTFAYLHDHRRRTRVGAEHSIA